MTIKRSANAATPVAGFKVHGASSSTYSAVVVPPPAAALAAALASVLAFACGGQMHRQLQALHTPAHTARSRRADGHKRETPHEVTASFRGGDASRCAVCCEEGRRAGQALIRLDDDNDERCGGAVVVVLLLATVSAAGSAAAALVWRSHRSIASTSSSASVRLRSAS